MPSALIVTLPKDGSLVWVTDRWSWSWSVSLSRTAMVTGTSSSVVAVSSLATGRSFTSVTVDGNDDGIGLRFVVAGGYDQRVLVPGFVIQRVLGPELSGVGVDAERGVVGAGDAPGNGAGVGAVTQLERVADGGVGRAVFVDRSGGRLSFGIVRIAAEGKP